MKNFHNHVTIKHQCQNCISLCVAALPILHENDKNSVLFCIYPVLQSEAVFTLANSSASRPLIVIMVSKDKSRAICWLQGRWIPSEHPAPAWVLSVQPLLLCNTKGPWGGEWGGSRAPSEAQHKYGINLHLSAIKRHSLRRLE